jgi:hypothetical protein
VIEDRRLRCKRTHRVPEQEQGQAAMPGTQRCPELRDVGDQSAEPGRTEVTQSTVGGSAMPTVIDRMHHEPRCIECIRKARIAFTVLGKAVSYLHHAGGLARDVGPFVRDDLRAIGGGGEG